MMRLQKLIYMNVAIWSFSAGMLTLIIVDMVLK